MFLLVPAYPGSPGPKAVKRLCVYKQTPQVLDTWRHQSVNGKRRQTCLDQFLRSYWATDPSSNVPREEPLAENSITAIGLYQLIRCGLSLQRVDTIMRLTVFDLC